VVASFAGQLHINRLLFSVKLIIIFVGQEIDAMRGKVNCAWEIHVKLCSIQPGKVFQ
jgi:hypothetical protein